MPSANGITNRTLAVVAVLLCAAALPATAQDYLAGAPDSMPNRGFYPGGSYSIGEIDAVNTYTGNVTLNLPLAKLPPARTGASFGVNLMYNSAILDVVSSAVGYYDGLNHTLTFYLQEQYKYSTVGGTAGGWRYGFQYGMGYDTLPQTTPVNCTLGRSEDLYPFQAYLTMPDGGRRNLHLQGVPGSVGQRAQISPDGQQPSCGGPVTVPSKLVYITVDGSYIRVEVTAGAWTVFLPEGTQVTGSGFTLPNGTDQSAPTAITDRNGNQIWIMRTCPTGQPCVSTIMDYLARDITITYGSQAGGTVDTVTWPGYGKTLQASINYGVVALPVMSYYCAPSDPGIPICGIGGNMTTVTSITLPQAKENGPQLSYAFDYTCPSCVSTWGELHKMTTPSGAVAKYSYRYDSVTAQQRGPGIPISPIVQKTLTYNEGMRQTNPILDKREG